MNNNTLPAFQPKPLPEVMARWNRDSVTRLRKQIADPAIAYADDQGVLRWRANQRIVPPHVIENDAKCDCTVLQRDAYERELAVFLAEYRANQRPPSEEERAEMRAAFGPGEKVVNVITGRVTQL